MSLRRKFTTYAADEEDEDEEEDLKALLAEMGAEKKKVPERQAPKPAPKPRKPAVQKPAKPIYCTRCRPECGVVQNGRCGRTGQLVDSSKLLEKGYLQVQQGNIMTFVSQKEAAVADDRELSRLKRLRKMALVLDIDLTLVHASPDPRSAQLLQPLPSSMSYVSDGIHEVEVPQGLDHRGHQRFQKFWVKFRPGVEKFLEECEKLFELSIYTAGNGVYANCLASILDPSGKRFRRVFSRSDTGDIVHTTKGMTLVEPIHERDRELMRTLQAQAEMEGRSMGEGEKQQLNVPGYYREDSTGVLYHFDVNPMHRHSRGGGSIRLEGHARKTLGNLFSNDTSMVLVLDDTPSMWVQLDRNDHGGDHGDQQLERRSQWKLSQCPNVIPVHPYRFFSGVSDANASVSQPSPELKKEKAAQDSTPPPASTPTDAPAADTKSTTANAAPASDSSNLLQTVVEGATAKNVQTDKLANSMDVEASANDTTAAAGSSLSSPAAEEEAAAAEKAAAATVRRKIRKIKKKRKREPSAPAEEEEEGNQPKKPASDSAGSSAPAPAPKRLTAMELIKKQKEDAKAADRRILPPQTEEQVKAKTVPGCSLDVQLFHTLNLLRSLHAQMFPHPTKTPSSADRHPSNVADLYRHTQGHILRGCTLSFTGVFSRNELHPQKHFAWTQSVLLGATMAEPTPQGTQQVADQPQPTHLVAVSVTEKVRKLQAEQAGQSTRIKIVSPHWLYAAIRYCVRPDESQYPAFELTASESEKWRGWLKHGQISSTVMAEAVVRPQQSISIPSIQKVIAMQTKAEGAVLRDIQPRTQQQKPAATASAKAKMEDNEDSVDDDDFMQELEAELDGSSDDGDDDKPSADSIQEDPPPAAPTLRAQKRPTKQKRPTNRAQQ